MAVCDFVHFILSFLFLGNNLWPCCRVLELLMSSQKQFLRLDQESHKFTVYLGSQVYPNELCYHCLEMREGIPTVWWKLDFLSDLCMSGVVFKCYFWFFWAVPPFQIVILPFLGEESSFVANPLFVKRLKRCGWSQCPSKCINVQACWAFKA